MGTFQELKCTLGRRKLWSTSCVHAHHSLPVLPGRSTHIVGLNSAHFTPKNVHVNIVGMYNYVRCCGM